MLNNKFRVFLMFLTAIMVIAIIVISLINLNASNSYKSYDTHDNLQSEWELNEFVEKFFSNMENSKFDEAYNMLGKNTKEQFNNVGNFNNFIKSYLIDSSIMKKLRYIELVEVKRTNNEKSYIYNLQILPDYTLYDFSKYTDEQKKKFYDIKNFNITVYEAYPYNYLIDFNKTDIYQE